MEQLECSLKKAQKRLWWLAIFPNLIEFYWKTLHKDSSTIYRTGKRQITLLSIVNNQHIIWTTNRNEHLISCDSIELHCASLLRIISCVISALSQRAHIDNLTGFIRGYALQRNKCSFFRKRTRWPKFFIQCILREHDSPWYIEIWRNFL